jgi:hypothetical protein
MSWARMPLSSWIRSRIESLQGSAPKTPTRSLEKSVLVSLADSSRCRK